MRWIRPALPLALLAIASLPACPGDDTETMADSGSMQTETNATTNTPTTDMPTSAGSADSSTGMEESVCPGVDIVGETTDGATDPLMDTWGAACATDQDCIDLIGDPGAICEFTAAMGVYELPDGYCTKPCSLPDTETRVLEDAADCDPEGGVACIGSMGIFERCARICTDDAQCNRNGYICRILPVIGFEGDPKQCLMPDCCQGSCAG